MLLHNNTAATNVTMNMTPGPTSENEDTIPRRSTIRHEDSVESLTIDEAIEIIGYGKFHKRLLFLCGVGYFAEITELVVMSFIAPSVAKDWKLSSFGYGLLGSMSFVGMAIGGFVWGVVSDRCGRQLAFRTTVWLTFVGGLASSIAPNFAALIASRFVASFGIGGMLPVDYTVFLEFLPSRKRGSKIVLVDAIGVIPALSLSAIASFAFAGQDHVQWRAVLALAAVPVGIMGLMRGHVPESPRYYLSSGQPDQAREVIENVAAINQVSLPAEWKLVNEIPTTGSSPYAPVDAELTRMNASSSTTPTLQEVPGSVPDNDSDAPPRDPSATTPLQATTPLVHREQNPREQSVFEPEALPYTEHGSLSQLLERPLRSISWRLWLLFFLVQFSSSGMVFALPTLLEQTFRERSDREIALDVLLGVLGLVPGLTIAYFAVDRSRTKSLAAFFVASGLSVIFLGLGCARKVRWQVLLSSVILRGSMEGCFGLLNTAAVESYPTILRASGLGTAQIFDHIAGSFSPIVFSYLNDYYRPSFFLLYSLAYFVAVLPALTLPDMARGPIHDSSIISTQCSEMRVPNSNLV